MKNRLGNRPGKWLSLIIHKKKFTQINRKPVEQAEKGMILMHEGIASETTGEKIWFASAIPEDEKKLKKIEQYQHVKLKDGREGCVVEIYGDQEIVSIDIGDSSNDWENIEVKHEEIIDPE